MQILVHMCLYSHNTQLLESTQERPGVRRTYMRTNIHLCTHEHMGRQSYGLAERRIFIRTLNAYVHAYMQQGLLDFSWEAEKDARMKRHEGMYAC
jgi:hypothetical protein